MNNVWPTPATSCVDRGARVRGVSCFTAGVDDPDLARTHWVSRDGETVSCRAHNPEVRVRFSVPQLRWGCSSAAERRDSIAMVPQVTGSIPVSPDSEVRS